MSTVVRCPSCKTPNSATRVFCTECGQKLDLSKITASKLAREKKSFNLFKVIRPLITLGLLAILVLLAWPMAGQGKKGTQKQALAMKRKLSALNDAANKGVSMVVELSEEELNAYLSGRFRDAMANVEFQGPLDIEGLNISVQGSRVTLVMKASLGPLPLSGALAGEAAFDDALTFDVSSVYAGHIPLPGAAQSYIIKNIETLLQAFDKEQTLLEKLKVTKWGEGSITVQPKSAPIITE